LAAMTKTAIHDFLYSDDTGLPMDCFAEQDVEVKAEEVFRHIYRAYPTLPSPYFSAQAAM
jgi:type I restriction enzyme, R subunit